MRKQINNTIIDRFRHLKTKHNFQIIQLDIREFYPLITEFNLDKSISLAGEQMNINTNEIKSIKPYRKSLLFDNEDEGIKKEVTFDITMGSFDGAITCELIVMHMLYEINKRIIQMIWMSARATVSES